MPTNKGKDLTSKKSSRKRKNSGVNEHETAEGDSCSDDSEGRSRPGTEQPEHSELVWKKHPPYRDFALVTDLPVPPERSRVRGGVRDPFPNVLHRTLENAENRGFSSICCWQPHGRAFRILDKDRFEKIVLPAHYNNQTSFASFQRQLNLYGFLRLNRNNSDQGAYYHEFFLRGRPDLTIHIHRIRVRGNRVRQTTDIQSEPDLSQYPALPLLNSSHNVPHAHANFSPSQHSHPGVPPAALNSSSMPAQVFANMNFVQEVAKAASLALLSASINAQQTQPTPNIASNEGANLNAGLLQQPLQPPQQQQQYQQFLPPQPQHDLAQTLAQTFARQQSQQDAQANAFSQYPISQSQPASHLQRMHFAPPASMPAARNNHMDVSAEPWQKQQQLQRQSIDIDQLYRNLMMLRGTTGDHDGQLTPRLEHPAQLFEQNNMTGFGCVSATPRPLPSPTTAGRFAAAMTTAPPQTVNIFQDTNSTSFQQSYQQQHFGLRQDVNLRQEGNLEASFVPPALVDGSHQKLTQQQQQALNPSTNGMDYSQLGSYPVSNRQPSLPGAHMFSEVSTGAHNTDNSQYFEAAMEQHQRRQFVDVNNNVINSDLAISGSESLSFDFGLVDVRASTPHVGLAPRGEPKNEALEPVSPFHPQTVGHIHQASPEITRWELDRISPSYDPSSSESGGRGSDEEKPVVDLMKAPGLGQDSDESYGQQHDRYEQQRENRRVYVASHESEKSSSSSSSYFPSGERRQQPCETSSPLNNKKTRFQPSVPAGFKSSTTVDFLRDVDFESFGGGGSQAQYLKSSGSSSCASSGNSD